MNTGATFFPKVSEIAHMGATLLEGTSTVAESVVVMGSRNLSDVVFQKENGNFAIFTVEDLMLFKLQKRDLSTRLCDLSIKQLSCVPEDENVLGLLQKFDESNSRYLGVQDARGELSGIVSYSDVLASVDPAVMMERRTLREILSTQKFEFVDGDALTEDVLGHLSRAEDAVLVMEQGKLAGILTIKDVIRIINENLDTNVPVRKYMTSPVQTLSHGETVRNAINFLKEKRYKRAIVVNDSDGSVVGAISQKDLVNNTYGRWADLMKLHANDLGELVETLESTNQKLLQDALTDPLTGIGNRKMFNQNIEAEIGRYYRSDTIPFSLLIIDIDHFKNINDTFGHLFGDKVLKSLCDRISGRLRVADRFARWGGEEFVLLLPDTGLDSASIVAEKIRSLVENSPVDAQHFTVSIGAAEYRKGESLEDFTSRADGALYRAKESGRNRVVVAGR